MCPDSLVEAFNNVGSWNVSFGCGAISITGAAIVMLRVVTGRSLEMHWDVLRTAGIYGGLLWVRPTLTTLPTNPNSTTHQP